MPNRYLNVHEKGDAVRLLAYNEGLLETLSRWQENKKNPGSHDKKLITYIKYAHTYLDKLCKAIFEPLDDKELKKILNYAKKVSVATMYSAEAKKEYETMMAMDSVMPVEMDDFYDICEQAVEVCNKACRKGPEEQKECRLREILMRHDVAVADERAPEGKCPYKL